MIFLYVLRSLVPVHDKPIHSMKLPFGRQPIMEPIPGDRVVPLHLFEDSLLVQGNNMAVSLVFDAVLDPERLRESLEGLVKQEGWQRLGGRLRKNVRMDDIRESPERHEYKEIPQKCILTLPMLPNRPLVKLNGTFQPSSQPRDQQSPSRMLTMAFLPLRTRQHPGYQSHKIDLASSATRMT